MESSFKKYAQQVVVNAQTLAHILHNQGYDIVSGGTDKHIVLMDLRNKKISAWVAAWALEYAGIVVNRNTVPGETGSSYYPSGLRMGTPAITTRGMKEGEMKQIAQWIVQSLEIIKDERIPEEKSKRLKYIKSIRKNLAKDTDLQSIAKDVQLFCRKFPVS